MELIFLGNKVWLHNILVSLHDLSESLWKYFILNILGLFKLILDSETKIKWIVVLSYKYSLHKTSHHVFLELYRFILSVLAELSKHKST